MRENNFCKIITDRGDWTCFSNLPLAVAHGLREAHAFLLLNDTEFLIPGKVWGTKKQNRGSFFSSRKINKSLSIPLETISWSWQLLKMLSFDIWKPSKQWSQTKGFTVQLASQVSLMNCTSVTSSRYEQYSGNSFLEELKMTRTKHRFPSLAFCYC